MWQKARDSLTLHAASWKLRWAEGMTFELDDIPDQTEDDIEEAILAGARESPGGSWTTVAKGVKGNAETKKAVRERLIAEGLLVNTGMGQAFALWHPDDVDDLAQTALDKNEVGLADMIFALLLEHGPLSACVLAREVRRRKEDVLRELREDPGSSAPGRAVRRSGRSWCSARSTPGRSMSCIRPGAARRWTRSSTGSWKVASRPQ